LDPLKGWSVSLCVILIIIFCRWACR